MSTGRRPSRTSSTLAASVAGNDYRDLPADSYADTLRFTVTP